MFAKQCPTCQKVSFSSFEGNVWLCPYCETDITNIPALRANQLIQEN